MMVDRDNELVNKDKQNNQKKRHERNQTANFNLEYLNKQVMLKKMEREAEKRRYSLTRGGRGGSGQLEKNFQVNGSSAFKYDSNNLNTDGDELVQNGTFSEKNNVLYTRSSLEDPTLTQT